MCGDVGLGIGHVQLLEMILLLLLALLLSAVQFSTAVGVIAMQTLFVCSVEYSKLCKRDYY
jgi:hypothetical protein